MHYAPNGVVEGQFYAHSKRPKIFIHEKNWQTIIWFNQKFARLENWRMKCEELKSRELIERISKKTLK